MAGQPQGTADNHPHGGTSPRLGETHARAKAALQDSSATATTAPPSAVPEESGGSHFSGAFMTQAPAWLVSMVLHVAVLLTLALIVTPPPENAGIKTIESPPTESVDDVEEIQPVDLTPDDQETQEEVEEVTEAPQTVEVETVEVVSDASDLAAAQTSIDVSDMSADISVSTDLLKTVGKSGGSKAGFGARANAATQKEMIKAGGGNPDEIIRAVESSCDWFKRHQMPDGGWSFDFRQCPGCMGKCKNPETESHLKDRAAATALALLPMLGQGYTHTAQGTKGKYRQQVDKGLAFLAQAVIAGQGKAYSGGGNMYSQGLVGIVLSEAYGMTKDQRLAVPAQAAIDFIMAAQDPVGGGWRYQPRQAGDTSAVCWQVMALKSGNMSGLRVDPMVVKKVSTFLDFVQSDGGAAYGYSSPGDRPALNAAGLLCRMFTEWKKTNEALLRGAKKLAKGGPSKDMYTSYYATQVLYHVKQQLPKEWDDWQRKMSQMLIKAQFTDGHQAGSYYEGFNTGHAPHVGGRIYVTSMATMTLEVYFKHGLPLYQDAGKETDDFVE